MGMKRNCRGMYENCRGIDLFEVVTLHREILSEREENKKCTKQSIGLFFNI